MSDNTLFLIFDFIVIFFAMTVHEVCHAIVAYKLGDDTAKSMGRISLNPLRHIDPFGTIILPLFLYFLNSPVLFGWAKPVILNPNNLKNPKLDSALIGIAGPLSNLATAVIFGILLRFLSSVLNLQNTMLLTLLSVIVIRNIQFAVFNLLPIPPLDGSKLLYGFLPARFYKVQEFLERYGTIIFLVFLFYGLNIIGYISTIFFHLIVGKWASI